MYMYMNSPVNITNHHNMKLLWHHPNVIYHIHAHVRDYLRCDDSTDAMTRLKSGGTKALRAIVTGLHTRHHYKQS